VVDSSSLAAPSPHSSSPYMAILGNGLRAARLQPFLRARLASTRSTATREMNMFSAVNVRQAVTPLSRHSRKPRRLSAHKPTALRLQG
jgi:hypothetical protein